ncbi:hypothetical protein AYO71_02540 [Pseudomonas koreensis]|nr:hypothetical protein AYO71_00010 [Pseudomonas koreensis]AMT86459.1 hypothetical protein AYO71_02540 [Pseudomonas koreensis]KJH75057.1 hypothetical protein UB23_21260 [Pseudomonas sp. ES3-33]PHN34167.1 hypothetical protein AO259_20445 [Pseudomonas sp. ICMP 564]
MKSATGCCLSVAAARLGSASMTFAIYSAWLTDATLPAPLWMRKCKGNSNKFESVFRTYEV